MLQSQTREPENHHHITVFFGPKATPFLNQVKQHLSLTKWNASVKICSSMWQNSTMIKEVRKSHEKQQEVENENSS